MGSPRRKGVRLSNILVYLLVLSPLTRSSCRRKLDEKERKASHLREGSQITLNAIFRKQFQIVLQGGSVADTLCLSTLVLEIPSQNVAFPPFLTVILRSLLVSPAPSQTKRC